MDIAALVQYDAPFEYELTHDGHGPLGVTFDLISINAPGPKAVIRRNQARLLMSNVNKEKLGEKGEAELVKFIEKNEGRTIEVLAACVVGWKWNGKSFGKLGKDPAFTPENVKEVLAVDWIFGQLDGVVSDIVNFTKA
jgi:hypothetical protein